VVILVGRCVQRLGSEVIDDEAMQLISNLHKRRKMLEQRLVSGLPQRAPVRSGQ